MKGMLILVMIAVMIAVMIVGIAIPASGALWKVEIKAIPELLEIWEAFRASCKVPEIHESWPSDALTNPVFQTIRNEAKLLKNEEKYGFFETQPMSKSPWAKDIDGFYSAKYVNHATPSVDYIFATRPKDLESECFSETRDVEYRARLGCFTRHVPADLEWLATEKIKALMLRLNLPNQFKRLADSRGATFMPPGGMMEMHSNQKHIAGWRCYFHYVKEDGRSHFYYRNPLNGGLHVVPDENGKANMFRVRRPPNKLIWHAITSDTERFAWGIWLPPELAQWMKQFGKVM